MLDKFLENNTEYDIFSEKVSQKTRKFTLYNTTTYDRVVVYGVELTMLHKKYQDFLRKHNIYGAIFKRNTIFVNYYYICGEIYEVGGGKISKVTGTKRPALVHNLKTKTKLLTYDYGYCAPFVRDLLIYNKMHNTREKSKFIDIELTRYDVGKLIEIVTNNTGTITGLCNTYISSDFVYYDKPRDEMVDLLRDNYVTIDKNYHTVAVSPKILNDSNFNVANNSLLVKFGTKNNKPVFEIKYYEIPSLKGVTIC
jgi:hypothetical protein